MKGKAGKYTLMLKTETIKALDMELSLANWLNPRDKLVVPNVSWGFDSGMHECDVFVITKANHAWEIEIKVSKSDLKRDQGKDHGHAHPSIKRLYFAVPHHMQDCLDLIPKHAGFLVVGPSKAFRGRYHRLAYAVKEVRPAQDNPLSRSLTIEQRLKVARLGTLRIWSLKSKLLKRRASG